MKRLAIIFGLLAGVWWVSSSIEVVGAACSQAPEPPESLNERLEALDARAAKIHGLRARFEQRKHTPMLKRPMVSRGTLTVLGPRSRWETTEPHPSVMTIDESSLRIYYPEHRVQEVFLIGQDVRMVSGSPLPRLSLLRELFEISEASEEVEAKESDGERWLALALRPKTDAFREHVHRVVVVIDTQVPIARRIVMEMADGDRTEMLFHDPVMDVAIQESDVEFKAPAGTRIVHPLGERELHTTESEPAR